MDPFQYRVILAGVLLAERFAMRQLLVQPREMYCCIYNTKRSVTCREHASRRPVALAELQCLESLLAG